MADIVLVCAKCRAQKTLSEYVSAAGLACDGCGTPLQRTGTPSDRPSLRSLTVRAHEEPVAQSAPTTQERAAILARFPEGRRRRRQREGPTDRMVLVLSWLLFVGLAGALWFARYRLVLGAQHHEMLVNAGMLGVAFMHLYVMSLAFTEDFFHGVLCLFVPGYTLYYLFLVTDAFYTRAVCAALLVAFGLDSFQFANTHLHDIYDYITRWFAEGGTPDW